MGLGNGSSNGSSVEAASSNGASSGALTPAGNKKGDGGVYYITSPEFTGGLGNREVCVRRLLWSWFTAKFNREVVPPTNLLLLTDSQVIGRWGR